MTRPGLRRASLVPLAPLAPLALMAALASCAKPSAEAVERPNANARGGGEAGSGAGGEAIAEGGSAPAVFVDPARLETLGALAADTVEGERYRVPIEADDMVFGPPTARVTVVVFNDYQCPYCGRFDRALRELMDTYPTDVRVVIKHFPLAMHQDASAAARAVLAAHRQGAGQAMHQLVFDNQKQLDEAGLRELARRAQVPDPRRFEADLADPALDAQIARDTALGAQLAVRSTPSYFVNGVPERGARELEELQAIYARELEAVGGLLEAGAARAEVYDALMANAAPTRAAPEPKPSSSARPGKPDPDLRYAIPIDGRPSRGSADALVTIVQFADFQCPYCKRVAATLEQLERRYGKDLRVVFMQQPLPFHPQAEGAALAALAAHRQGKFWEMHDAIYAENPLTDASFEKLAKQLGLDLGRFRKDVRSKALLDQIHEDQAVASRFGANGTPTFFINGRYLSGAQPVEAFAALVDEELAAAKAYAKNHKVAKGGLYQAMAKNWEAEVQKPGVADSKRQPISLAGLPARGKTNKPPIELVVCADFDCPYCGRGAQMVEQAMADSRYKGKIGFYFLHFPLPMHVNAEAAHRAAIAAGEQGKFWEMHDLLFANKGKRSEAELVDFAKQLGLDTQRFRQDMSSPATDSKLAQDKATCSQLGVTGTPNFFVNGRSMRGAQPLSAASEVFDEELGR